LIAYTIYLDSALTFGTVITNLFNLTTRPSLVEFTAWSVVGCGTSIISATLFLYLFPRFGLSLKQWAVGAYGLVTLLTIWCLIGMSDKVSIGFKHRVEFYLFQVIQNMAGAILTPLFRVLFPEVFPKGSEIQYFGFQMVVSLQSSLYLSRR
jgi:MFS-type transporter involved in bile tolerance (Atg22 family)